MKKHQSEITPADLEALESSVTDLRNWNHSRVNQILEAIPNGQADWAKSFLRANMTFHNGNISDQHKSSKMQRFLVQFAISLARWTGARGLFLSHRLLGRRSENAEYTNLAAAIVTLRYTNFTLGLLYSAQMVSDLKAPEYSFLRQYYLGLMGHFLCLNGCFARGLYLLKTSVDEIESKEYPKTCSFLRLELEAILGVHEMYAGETEKSKSIFNSLMGRFSDEKYVWLEVFTRSARTTFSTEILDSEALLQDTTRLQQLLGPAFQSKFGLRTLICSALIAGLKNDPIRAFSLIVQAEQLYGTQMSKVELGRYHILRALTELELEDTSKALYHSRRSREYLSGIEGAVYFNVDATLLEAEVALRSLRLNPGPQDRVEAKFWAKRIRQSLKKIDGAAGLKARADFLLLIAKSIESRSEGAFNAVANARVLKTLSPRQQKLASNLSGNRLGASEKPKIQGFQGASESAISNFVRTMATCLENKLSRETVAELLKSASLSERVDFRTEGSAKSGALRPGELKTEYGGQGNAKVELSFSGLVHEFELVNPLLDVRVNPLATEQFKLISKLVEAENSKESQLDIERTIAIANTTQALAHDCRKPFSMFKMIIDTVKNSKTVEEARELLQESLPEVEQAMAAVDGMIQDVMQIGSDSKPLLEEATAESLVESAISDLFRVYPLADVSLSYSFEHQHFARVDTVRLSRVFANILGNAVQAMSEKGRIWIKTREQNQILEFTLGNSDSHIPLESLSKLFDAFFTSGKKGGTGLGLAIAKKTVESHGGTIFCRSEKNAENPSGFVEFVFTLPTANKLDPKSRPALPSHSSEIHATFERFRTSLSGAERAADKFEAELEGKVVLALRKLPQKPVLLIADDEAVYRNNLIAMTQRSSEIAALLDVKSAVGDSDILESVTSQKPLLLIQDIDLGAKSRNGLEVILELRASGFDGHICVHSNRFLDDDVNKAVAAGANFTIPKPLSRTHLLKLLLAALGVDRRVGAEARAAVVEPNRRVEDSPKGKPKVAYVDDTFAFLMGAKQRLADHVELVTFRSSADLLNKIEQEASFLGSLSLLITDFYLDKFDCHNGLTLTRAVKSMGLKCPVILASEVDLQEPEENGCFDRQIGKAEIEMSVLMPFLSFGARIDIDDV